jgi:hypothetical protein
MVAIFCEQPHPGEDARYTQKAANLVPNVDMMIDSLFKTEYLQKIQHRLSKGIDHSAGCICLIPLCRIR